MSVRDVILGLLTLGPAYGHQLLFEIHTRLPHRATVNPGQVYATLTRLVSNGLIEGAGVSVEQLPLYRLSATGKVAADSWLCAESDVDVSDWSDVLDVVLLSLTLPDTRTHETCDGIRRKLGAWTTPTTGGAEDAGQLQSFVHESRYLHATAVTEWLDDVSNASNAKTNISRGFTPDRPRRGRRPNLVQ